MPVFKGDSLPTIVERVLREQTAMAADGSAAAAAGGAGTVVQVSLHTR